ATVSLESFTPTRKAIMQSRIVLSAFAALAIGAAACSGSSNTTTAGIAPTTTAATTGSVDAAATVTGAATASAQSAANLNLTTPSPDQFTPVPNVGDRFGREFMESRPYPTIVQFRRELGKYVSQDQVKQWEQYLYVPVDPNAADAETLHQLPGVTAA